MTTLRVLTLNVWGLHYLACRIQERLGHIVEELKTFDIVGLQEVWSSTDYDFLVKTLESTLTYSHYFYSSIIGSGLCVFSRYPIISAFSHQFSVTGGIKEFADGEVFAGKGILGCRIKTPCGALTVFTLHLNPRCRDSQLFEAFQFIDRTRGDLPVILTGDFNTKPTHLAFSLMTKCLGLQDAFEDFPVDTCDLMSNIYTVRKMTPKRIDFILHSDELSTTTTLRLQPRTQSSPGFYRLQYEKQAIKSWGGLGTRLLFMVDSVLRILQPGFSTCGIEAHIPVCENIERKLTLNGHIPGKDFPYSDHEGVEATFLLEAKAIPTAITHEKVFDDEAVGVLLGVAKNISTRKAKYETSTTKVFTTWMFLILFSFICAILLSNHWFFTLLAGYYMHWLCTVATSVVGAAAIFQIFVVFSNIQLAKGMDSNLAEIRTLLKYSRTQNGNFNTCSYKS